MNVLRESRFTTELAEEVFQSKRKNEIEMNTTAASIRHQMKQTFDNQAEIKRGWKEWRLKMPRHVQTGLGTALNNDMGLTIRLSLI